MSEIENPRSGRQMPRFVALAGWRDLQGAIVKSPRSGAEPAERTATLKVRRSRSSMYWLGSWRLPYSQTSTTCKVSDCVSGSEHLATFLIDGEICTITLCDAHLGPVAVAAGGAPEPPSDRGRVHR